MSEMKIAVYTVALNERCNIAEWYDSVQQADIVFIADTGSTDGSQNVYDELAIHWKPIYISPWRFDLARNAALASLPADVDVCLTIDLDERISPGWRKALESKWKVGEHNSGFFMYEFAPDFIYAQSRIHQRSHYQWILPAHEGVYPYLLDNPKTVLISDILVKQTQQPKDRLTRDNVLTELGYKERPNDQRAIFYYARQLVYNRQPDKAIELLTRYFSMGPTFPWEARQAALALAEAWQQKGG